MSAEDGKKRELGCEFKIRRSGTSLCAFPVDLLELVGNEPGRRQNRLR